MYRTISGLVAAIAVMTAGAAPALACGFGSCSPCATGYVSPCGVWGYDAYERLAEPSTQYHPTMSYYPTAQYYYVNQGPTYSGPGMFAPYPAYQEDAVSGWGGYARAPYRHGRHRHYDHSYR